MRFKDGDRVESVYLNPGGIGTVKVCDGKYLIVYDDEPDVEYQILDDNYLEYIETDQTSYKPAKKALKQGQV